MARVKAEQERQRAENHHHQAERKQQRRHREVLGRNLRHALVPLMAVVPRLAREEPRKHQPPDQRRNMFR